MPGPGGRPFADPTAMTEVAQPSRWSRWLLILLFLLWGMANALNDILIKQFRKSGLASSDFASGFVQSAFYAGYFVGALPAGRLVASRGEQHAILVGLGTLSGPRGCVGKRAHRQVLQRCMFAPLTVGACRPCGVELNATNPRPPPGITALFACGCLLFYPAAELASYPAFLAALSVIALGLAHLECAANPFVARLAEEQAPGSGAAALTMAQAFNPLGSVIGVMVGQLCVLKASRHPIVAPSLRVCVCPGRSHGRPSL